MGANYTKSLYKEYELVLSQKEKLEAEYKALRINFQLMHKEIQRLSKAETELRETAARMEREKQELIWENIPFIFCLNVFCFSESNTLLEFSLFPFVFVNRYCLLGYL